MRKTIRIKFVAVLSLTSLLFYLVLPLGFQRAEAHETDEQDTLITDSGNNRIIQVDSSGRIVWVYRGAFDPWQATRLSDGHTLVADTSNGRVIEIDLTGTIVWQISAEFPYSAERLDNGNTLYTDQGNRVTEVAPSGVVVWQMTNLNWPYYASRLTDGNTLIVETGNNRVIEVNPNKDIIWQVGAGEPMRAQRLDNGNTLIAGTGENRVFEVDNAGNVVWQVYPGYHPYSAVRLANGNTLVDGMFWSDTEVQEFDQAGSVVWGYNNLSFSMYAERVPHIDYVNRVPIANAGGPYVADENSLATFDASGSYDPLDDTLQYRWDVDNNGTWDTDWSPSPRTSMSWADDYSGSVVVEVTDGELSATAVAEVTVTNVNPITNILAGLGAVGNYVVVSTTAGRTYFLDLSNGSFSSPSLIDDKADGMYGASVGDYDNDGSLEMLAGDAGDVWYYDKNGAGNSFDPAVSVTHDKGNTKRDFAEADYNNDGNLDAIMAGSASGLMLLTGNGDGTFSVQLVNTNTSITGLDAADFNADGLMDFVATDTKGTLLMFFGRGNGTFDNPVTQTTKLSNSWGVAAGDFNNDGLADVVLGQSPAMFFPGNGTGGFGPPNSLGFSAYGLATADFNRDGMLDLLTTDGKSRLTAYAGHDNGTFSVASEIAINDLAIYGVGATYGGPDQINGVEGQLTSFQAIFSDQGYVDTHAATWNWGDGSPVESGLVTETNNPPIAQGTVTGVHQYDNPGEYSVTLTVSDDDGGITTDTVKVVIIPNTQPGTDVLVNPAPGVDVTFSGVTQDGSTTATVSDQNPGPGQAGFRFLGTYYDISTTATYTPPVTICLSYDDTGMSAGRENALKILHWDGVTWTNVTSSLDTVGNSICGTAWSFSWFAVAEEDTTSPVITITAPQDNTAYFLNQGVTADWSVSDEATGVQSAVGSTVSGQPIDTATVGEKTYTVTATDEAGNVTIKQITYQVRYKNSGVLQPINADGSSLFKINRTIPVKFRLTDFQNQTAPAAVAHLSVSRVSNSVIGQVPAVELLATGDAGGIFRFGSSDQQYMYNLSTSGLTAGTYQLHITLDDGGSSYTLVSMR